MEREGSGERVRWWLRGGEKGGGGGMEGEGRRGKEKGKRCSCDLYLGGIRANLTCCFRSAIMYAQARRTSCSPQMA